MTCQTCKISCDSCTVVPEVIIPSMLEASFVGHKQDAIHKVESLQTTGKHIEGHISALTLNAEPPSPLSFNEFQFSGATVLDEATVVIAVKRV